MAECALFIAKTGDTSAGILLLRCLLRGRLLRSRLGGTAAAGGRCGDAKLSVQLLQCFPGRFLVFLLLFLRHLARTVAPMAFAIAIADRAGTKLPLYVGFFPFTIAGSTLAGSLAEGTVLLFAFQREPAQHSPETHNGKDTG